jgi:syntaxin 16
LYKL